jgi:hypothetical protein
MSTEAETKTTVAACLVSNRVGTHDRHEAYQQVSFLGASKVAHNVIDSAVTLRTGIGDLS